MSLFEELYYVATAPLKMVGDVMKSAEAAFGKKKEAHVHKSQKQMLNDQIKSYQEQTELSKQEMNRAKDSQDAEKRRIQEKQIKAVRRQSSMRGFLGTSGDEMDTGVNSTLGT